MLALLALVAVPRVAQAADRASLVREVMPGITGSQVSMFGALDTLILFAGSSAQGEELWRSDGTAAGTFIVKDIAPGPFSSSPREGVRFHDHVYFAAAMAPQIWRMGPYDLWRTDGTTAGTELVKDVDGDLMSQLVVADGSIFFTTGPRSGAGPWTLWRSDGTAAGTTAFPTGPAVFSNPDRLTGAANQLFFAAKDSAGFENLFRSDGTATGTVQLTQFQLQWLRFLEMVSVGDRLFFQIDDHVHGNEIWVSDGTSAGTHLVSDLEPGIAGTSVGEQVVFHGRLAFTNWTRHTLMITDGTEAGTQVLYETSGTPAFLRVIGDTLFFVDDDEIWMSDGTAAGTKRFIDLGAVPTHPYQPRFMVGFNGAVYFAANSDGYSWQIWRSDGTIAGTRMATRLFANESSEVDSLTVVSDTLFFFGADDAHGRELWKLVDDPGYTPSARVDDGLAALYTFEEGSGRTVQDRSGVNAPLDLTLSRASGYTWVSNGLRLNGGTALFSSRPASKIIDAAKLSEEVTVEAWVTPANVSQYSARIATISGSATTRNLALIYGVYDTRQPTVLSARIRTSPTVRDGGRALLSPNNTLGPRLLHLVYTRSGEGIMRMYVDGVQVAASNGTGSLASWDANFRLGLGGEIGGGHTWRGTYHLVAFYGRALSAVEVEHNFSLGPDGE